MYWKTPLLIEKYFDNYIWHGDRKRKVIHLTFDDGPTPIVTHKVLDILSDFEAKATFFCLGRNVDRHPELFQLILNNGHAVGNHSYSHLKGWSTPAKMYFHDANLAKKYIQSKLFRPPYGRITRLQSKYIRKDYKIIMWDVLSHDYNMKIPEKMCLRNAIRHTKNGSYIVFHDSLKASKNLLYTLPRYIDHFKEKGYTFESIT